MNIATIVRVCIILIIQGNRLPRDSCCAQKGVDRTLGTGQRSASKLPGKAGDLAEKPFSSSRKAANKSAQKGREGRSKMPT